MITIFLKTAWRSILRNRAHTALNILGFSTGLACFALIVIWLNQQLSFDSTHTDGERIFQVNAQAENESSSWKQATTPAPLVMAMNNEFPEIENVLRLDFTDAVVRGEKESFKEDWIVAADPSFFTFYNFKLVKGNAALALTNPYSIVLSESMAKKYFGDVDPINKSLRLFSYDPDGQGADYLITGVIEDCPAGTHFTYSMLISFSTIEKAEPETLTTSGWSNHEYYTYVKLKDASLSEQIETRLPPLVKKNAAVQASKNRYHYFLTPLREVHFQTDIRGKIQPGVSKAYMVSFGAIAFIVLLFACINYVNLSTAFAIDRYKEVGIRKVLGSSRRRLVLQYLTQSWMMAMLAMIVAIGWMEVARPLFEVILESNLAGSGTNIYSINMLLTLFAIASMAGILSGIYPALLIASVQPIRIVKGYFSKGSSGMAVRKVLVVVQYSVTVLLLIAVMTVHRQLKFIQNTDLGFNSENLVVLAMNGSPEAVKGYSSFYDAMKSVGSVAGIARSNTSIGGGNLDGQPALAETAYGTQVDIHINTVGVDHDYLDTYGIELGWGKNFRAGSSSDSAGVIINETAARSLGFLEPQDAVGKRFRLDNREGQVIGVIKDIHHASLHEQIEPLALFLLQEYYSRITVNMTGNPITTIQLIEDVWKKSFPSTVFDYAFADDRLQNSYRQEDRFAKLYFVFSAISIVIASLGLFALVSYSVERRTKEIGIRKVLGANLLQVSTLLSKEFLVLVAISCAIAMPLGWYAMREWLQNFAYHINPGATIILGAGLITVILALSTLGIKTVKSALANPVDSLRAE